MFKSPFFLAVCSIGILLALFLLDLIIIAFTGISISILILFIYIGCIIILGKFYQNKYDEKMSINLIFKTALYSAIFLFFIFLIVPIIFLLNKSAITAIIAMIIAVIAAFAYFSIVYFSLKKSNNISFDNLKILKD